ncbi:MAG: YIP1 family protein [Turicibacter sp.]|nr:YIP1 family protein [Turicibacter sp.]
MNETQETQIEDLPPPTMTQPTKLLSLFIAPIKLMEALKTNPTIFLPLMLIIAINLASILLLADFNQQVLDHTNTILMEHMLDQGLDITPLLPVMDEYGIEPTGVDLNFLLIINSIFAPLILGVIYAFLLWLMTKIARGDATFPMYFSLYIHTAVITTFGTFLSTLLMAQLSTFTDPASLAAFLMPTSNLSSPLFNFLSTITIFSLYSAILTFFALKTFNDFKTKALIIATLAYLIPNLTLTLITSLAFIIV